MESTTPVEAKRLLKLPKLYALLFDAEQVPEENRKSTMARVEYELRTLSGKINLAGAVLNDRSGMITVLELEIGLMFTMAPELRQRVSSGGREISEPMKKTLRKKAMSLFPGMHIDPAALVFMEAIIREYTRVAGVGELGSAQR